MIWAIPTVAFNVADLLVVAGIASFFTSRYWDRRNTRPDVRFPIQRTEVHLQLHLSLLSGTVRSTAWCALDAALWSLGIRPGRRDLGDVLTGAQIVTTVVTRSEGASSAWSRTWPVA